VDFTPGLLDWIPNLVEPQRVDRRQRGTDVGRESLFSTYAATSGKRISKVYKSLNRPPEALAKLSTLTCIMRIQTGAMS
jgi:hypothetical protein